MFEIQNIVTPLFHRAVSPRSLFFAEGVSFTCILTHKFDVINLHNLTSIKNDAIKSNRLENYNNKFGVFGLTDINLFNEGNCMKLILT